MVDMAGNYGVYCTDMTRTYSIGRLSDEATAYMSSALRSIVR